MSNQNSRQVEERVVSMQFDNAQFERNTRQTLSTLDKLKQKMQFKGAGESFKNLSREANKFNLNGVNAAVATCGQKISAWSVAGITAIANITNSAVEAGKRITRALTIEPVTTGFQEYETKIGAIQTIMSNTRSKGTTMEQVVDTLDELNKYADLTIYNFAEMTKNIGTFTAAGIELEDAASAIQGIANLAAASGSTSQQASTAMYQLSQALAAGSLKLQDWNSVVNAGMGGQLFQDALKQTAKEYGIAVDEIIEQSGSFRESLSKGWISADILSTTLRKFTRGGAKEYAKAMIENGEYTEDMAKKLEEEAAEMEDAATKVKTFTQLWDTLKETAQSGWGKTWELIIGNFEEARTLFTDINDRLSPLIDRISDARNNLIESALGSPAKWDEITERLDKAGISMEAFKDSLKISASRRGIDLDAEIEKYGSLEAAFANGSLKANMAVEAIKRVNSEMMGWKRLEEGVTAEDRLKYFQDRVTETWRGDWGNGIDRLNAMTEADVDYAAVQELVNKTIDGHTLKLEEMSTAQLKAFGLTEAEVKEIESLRKALDGANPELREMLSTIDKKTGRQLMIDSLTHSMDAIASVIKPIKEGFDEIFEPIKAESIYHFLEGLEKFTKGLILTSEQGEKLKRTFKGVFAAVDAIRFVLGSALRLVLKVVGGLLGDVNIDFLTLTATLGDGLAAVSKWIKEHDLIGKVMDKLAPKLKIAGEAIGAWVEKLKASDNLPKDIMNGIANGLGFAAKLVGDAFKGLFESLGINIDGLLESIDLSNVGTAMASMMGMIKDTIKKSFSLKDVASNAAETGKTMMQATGKGIVDAGSLLFKALQTVFGKLVTWLRDNIDPGAVVAGVFIGSMMHTLNTLAGVVDKFAGPAKALTGMFNNIGGAFESFGKVADGFRFNTTATGVLTLAAAVAVLAGSIFIISKIPKEDLTRSLLTIVGMSAIILGMLAILELCNNMTTQSSGIDMGVLVGLGVGLLAIVFAIKAIAKEDPEKLEYAIMTVVSMMAAMMALITIVTLVTKNSHNDTVKSFGGMMLMLGVSIFLIASAIKKIAKIKKSDVKKGLAVITGVAAIFGALILASGVVKENAMLGFAAAIFTMGRAIKHMVKTIPLAASISDDDLKQAIKVMGGMALIMAGLALISRIGGKLSAGISVLGMAVGMVIMAYVIKYINTIDMGEIDYAKIVIAAVGALFLKFLATSLIAGKNSAKAGLMLIEASIAMGIMAGLIYLIGGMKEERVNRGLGAVSALAYFMAMMVKATRGAESITGTVIALAICVAVLSAAAFALAFVPAKKLAKSTAALTTMVLAFATVINNASRIKASAMKSLIVVFSGMAVLIMEMMVVSIILALPIFDSDKILKNIAAMSAMMVALAVLLRAVGKSSTSLSAAGFGNVMAIVGELAIMALLFIELAFVLKVIGWMGDPTASWMTLLQITTLMVVLGGVALAISKFSTNANFGDMGKTVAIMAILGAVMLEVAALLTVIDKYLPSNVNWNTLAQISVMMVVLTALAIAIDKFSTVVNFGSMMGAIGSIAVLAVVALEVAAILWLIDKYLPSNTSWKTLAQISLMLGVLVLIAAPLAILGNFTGAMLGGAVALGALAVVMIVLAFALSCMSGIDPVQGLAAAESLSLMLFTLAVVCAICIALGAGAELALPGIGVLAILAVALAAGIKAFTELGIDDALVKTGVALGMFGMAIRPFVDTLAALPGNMVENAVALGEALAGLLGVAVLDKIIEKFGGGDWSTTITDKLIAFGEGISQFAATLGDGIDTELITSAAGLGDALAALNNSMPTEIPWLEGIFGKKDIGSFGQKLGTFAEAMVEFGKVVKDKNLDKDSIETFCEAVEPILKIAKDIPNSGGLLGLLAGNNEINTWGRKLVPFARYMLGFGAAIKHGDWNKEPFEKFKECVTPILTIADEIPNSGGIIGAIVGENDIDVFGKRLAEFGKGMGGLYDAVKDKNWDKTLFESVQECVAVLIDISHDLDNTGGMIQFFAGQQDLGNFGTQLKRFGAGLAGFDEAITGASSFSSGIAVRMTQDIVKLAEVFPSKKEIKTITDGVDNMEKHNLGLKLTYLGGVLTQFATATSSLNNETLDNASTSLDLLATALKKTSDIDFGNLSEFESGLANVGVEAIEAFAESFETSYSKIGEAISRFLTRVEETFEYNKYKWRFIGRHAMEALGDGIIYKIDTVNGKVQELMSNAINTASSYDISFEWIGGNFVLGLMRGIDQYKEMAKNSAAELGNVTAAALAEALKVESPSKVTMGIGEYTGMGFVKGLQQYLSISEGTAEDLGEATTDTLSDVLAEALTLFDDSNLHPTITPVLDLSMVNDGFASIDNLLANKSINVGGINNIGVKGASNDDVIRAINDLSASLGNISGDTYYFGDIRYDDNSAVSNAVKELLSAAKIARRV